MVTPVSVNANGFAPPNYCLCGITFCDTTVSISVSDKLKHKILREALRAAQWNEHTMPLLPNLHHQWENVFGALAYLMPLVGDQKAASTFEKEHPQTQKSTSYF